MPKFKVSGVISFLLSFFEAGGIEWTRDSDGEIIPFSNTYIGTRSDGSFLFLDFVGKDKANLTIDNYNSSVTIAIDFSNGYKDFTNWILEVRDLNGYLSN